MGAAWQLTPEDFEAGERALARNAAAIEAVQNFAIAERTRLCNDFPSWSTEHDIRIGLLAKQVSITRTAALAFAIMRANLTHAQWWHQVFGAAPPPRDGAEIIHGFDRTHHTAVMHGTFVVFDSGLRVIARALGATDRMVSGSFKPLLDWLIAGPLLSLRDSDVPILINLWRHVRNSFHNNGLHVDPNGRDTRVVYRGQTYDFIHGRPVEGGWLRIALWAHGAVEAGSVIARHPAVAAIASREAIDPYSSHVELPPWTLQREALSEDR